MKSTVIRVIGKVLCISAICGEKKVQVRARKLEIPKAVTLNRGGKSVVVAAYITLNADAHPNLTIRIKLLKMNRLVEVNSCTS